MSRHRPGTVPRKLMRPGQIFALYPSFTSQLRPPLALVVVDSVTEVDFWTGAVYSIGDVLPGMEYELL